MGGAPVDTDHRAAVDQHALDRLHVGELLIVYHALCGAEHMPDKVGFKTVEAKLIASYQRLVPSLGVTPQEDRAMLRCFSALAQGDDFRLAWHRLNGALEACRAAGNVAVRPSPLHVGVVGAPLLAYNRVRRCKMCFRAWVRYCWSCQITSGTAVARRDADYAPNQDTAAAGGAVSLTELAGDPMCSSPIACSCMLVFMGMGLAAAERRAHLLPPATPSRLRAGWVTALVRGRYKTMVLAVWKSFTNRRQLQRVKAAARVEALGTARSGQDAFFAWNLWAWRKARKRWAVPLAARYARAVALSRCFQHWARKSRLGRRAAQAQERHFDRQQGITGFERRDRQGWSIHHDKGSAADADDSCRAMHRVRVKLRDSVSRPPQSDGARHMRTAAKIATRFQLEEDWATRAEQKVRELAQASREVLSDMVGGELDSTETSGHPLQSEAENVAASADPSEGQNTRTVKRSSTGRNAPAPMAHVMPFTAISAVAGGGGGGGGGDGAGSSGASSADHGSIDLNAPPESTKKAEQNVAAPSNRPGQPYTTKSASCGSGDQDSGPASTATGSNVIRRMRVEHALLLAKVLELQAAAAEQGEDLVITLQAEQVGLKTTLLRDPEPEAEERPDDAVPISEPEPEPELDLLSEAGKELEPDQTSVEQNAELLFQVEDSRVQNCKESVERLLNFPEAGWNNSSSKKRQRSPAEKAKLAAMAARKLKERFGRSSATVAAEMSAASAWADANAKKQDIRWSASLTQHLSNPDSPQVSMDDVTVAGPAAFSLAGRAFYFGTQDGALEALLAYNVRRIYRKTMFVWSKFVKWMQHYAFATRDADSMVELCLIRPTHEPELEHPMARAIESSTRPNAKAERQLYRWQKAMQPTKDADMRSQPSEAGNGSTRSTQQELKRRQQTAALSTALAVVEYRKPARRRPRPDTQRSRPRSATLGGTAAWRSQQAAELHARRQALARNARAVKREEEEAALNERLANPVCRAPSKKGASDTESEPADGEGGRRDRRKLIARVQQASREDGVLPFMGAVPVSRKPGVRDLWDNPRFPPENEADVGGDKQDSLAQPATLLPMNHQGVSCSTGSVNENGVGDAVSTDEQQPQSHWQTLRQFTQRQPGMKKQMDLPHKVLTPPASPAGSTAAATYSPRGDEQPQEPRKLTGDTLPLPPSSRLDESSAALSIFLTPDTSPAATVTQDKHKHDVIGRATATTGTAGIKGWPAVFGIGRGRVEDLPDSPETLGKTAEPQQGVPPCTDRNCGNGEIDTTIPKWVVNGQRAYSNAAAAKDKSGLSAPEEQVSSESLVSSFRGGQASAYTTDALAAQQLESASVAAETEAMTIVGTTMDSGGATAGTAKTLAHEKATSMTPPPRRRSLEPQALLNAYRTYRQARHTASDSVDAYSDDGAAAAPETADTNDRTGVGQATSTATVASPSDPLTKHGMLDLGQWIEKRSALYDQPYWEHSITRQQTWTKPTEPSHTGDDWAGTLDHGQQPQRTESSNSAKAIWDSIAENDNDTLYTTADAAAYSELLAVADDTSFDSSKLSLTNGDEDGGEETAKVRVEEGQLRSSALSASARSFSFATDKSHSLSSIDEISAVESSSGSGSGSSGSGDSNLGVKEESAAKCSSSLGSDALHEEFDSGHSTDEANDDEQGQASWTPPGPPPTLRHLSATHDNSTKSSAAHARPLANELASPPNLRNPANRNGDTVDAVATSSASAARVRPPPRPATADRKLRAATYASKSSNADRARIAAAAEAAAWADVKQAEAKAIAVLRSAGSHVTAVGTPSMPGSPAAPSV